MISLRNAQWPPSARSMRVAALVAASGGGALIGAAAITLAKAREVQPAVPPAGVRCALVLGCPVGPALTARVAAAAALCLRYNLTRLVISGAGEAAMGAVHAQQAGVDPKIIRLEEQARNTRENIVLSKPLLDDGPTFIVTDRLHLPRALRWARRLDLTALPWPVDRAVARPLRAITRESFAVLAELTERGGRS